MPMPHFHAARIKDPSQFCKRSFRNIEIRPGVQLIVAKEKGHCGPNGSMKTQAYRFDHCVYTADEAVRWLKDHGVKTSRFEKSRSKCRV